MKLCKITRLIQSQSKNLFYDSQIISKRYSIFELRKKWSAKNIGFFTLRNKGQLIIYHIGNKVSVSKVNNRLVDMLMMSFKVINHMKYFNIPPRIGNLQSRQISKAKSIN